ncbi:helix-turn-helix domain-containing protein [Streptomyces sp. NPDC058155]|uniref:helix-turn-helix domain-containing protein n=1 Tax=Streptomyces sp. NPDC058155 TaxID=3346359 RepID=UPI0036EE3669
MTDAPTRAQRFAALVVPAAERAGYIGHGAGARLARDTGMSETSVSRMLAGTSIPKPEFLQPLAEAIGLDVRELLVAGLGLDPKIFRPLSETEQSQVGSRSITPSEAADRLGITDPIGREMLTATIERLRRLQDESAPGQNDSDNGGTAARM